MNNLTKDQLLVLIDEYDNYISGIIDDLPLHLVDRVPVSISEFYYNDHESEWEG